jgi:hypothetical protein
MLQSLAPISPRVGWTLTFGSLETLGILNAAIVDMLVMRGRDTTTDEVLEPLSSSRSALNAIDQHKNDGNARDPK